MKFPFSPCLKFILTHFPWLNDSPFKHVFLVFCRHTWQVQDKIDANNVAYTTGKLSFHTDYPALHHPPGVRWASAYFPQGRPRSNILLYFESRRLYVSLAHLSYIGLSPNIAQTHKISVPKSWIASHAQGIEDFHVFFFFNISSFLPGNNSWHFLLCQDIFSQQNILRSFHTFPILKRVVRENETRKHNVEFFLQSRMAIIHIS